MAVIPRCVRVCGHTCNAQYAYCCACPLGSNSRIVGTVVVLHSKSCPIARCYTNKACNIVRACCRCFGILNQNRFTVVVAICHIEIYEISSETSHIQGCQIRTLDIHIRIVCTIGNHARSLVEGSNSGCHIAEYTSEIHLSNVARNGNGSVCSILIACKLCKMTCTSYNTTNHRATVCMLNIRVLDGNRSIVCVVRDNCNIVCTTTNKDTTDIYCASCRKLCKRLILIGYGSTVSTVCNIRKELIATCLSKLSSISQNTTDEWVNTLCIARNSEVIYGYSYIVHAVVYRYTDCTSNQTCIYQLVTRVSSLRCKSLVIYGESSAYRAVLNYRGNIVGCCYRTSQSTHYWSIVCYDGYILQVQALDACVCSTEQRSSQALDCVAVTKQSLCVTLDWSPSLAGHIDIGNHQCVLLQGGSLLCK